MKPLITLFFVLFSLCQLISQASSNPSPIIFIYDASGSMWGQLEGKTKMEIASEVLSSSISQLPDNQSVGLVAYGHRQKGDCEDVEFLVNTEASTKEKVIQSLKGIKPLGKTPLAYSALKVIEKLRSAKMKASIILVTDGIESCNGDLCAVIKAAQEEGIDFRLHIIGFGLKAEETEQLRCAAQAGKGQYFDAANAGDLTTVLNEATEVTVDDPAGNFSFFTIRNGEPIDAYIKAFPTGSKTAISSARTYGDTTFLYLPPGKYDFEVKPLGNSDVSSTVLKDIEGIKDEIVHRTVSFDAGKLTIMSLNNGEGWDAVIRVYPKGSNRAAAQGRTYGKGDIYELNPGVYDVVFKAMVINGIDKEYRMENVEIKGREEKELTHNFKSGTLFVGANSSAGLVDATVNIIETGTKTNVARSRTYKSESSNPKKFILSPGTYEVKVKALGEHKGKIQTIKVEIKAEETVKEIANF